jgi:hypothetical protein
MGRPLQQGDRAVYRGAPKTIPNSHHVLNPGDVVVVRSAHGHGTITVASPTGMAWSVLSSQLTRLGA